MKTWKSRKGEITSKSRPVKSDGEYSEDRAYNYLWELTNLGDYVPAFAGMRIFKDGFARYTYSNGWNGVESRVKQTLRDMEKTLHLDHGVLKGRIHWAKVGTFDETLSAEQFFHEKAALLVACQNSITCLKLKRRHVLLILGVNQILRKV